MNSSVATRINGRESCYNIRTFSAELLCYFYSPTPRMLRDYNDLQFGPLVSSFAFMIKIIKLNSIPRP